MTTVQAPLRKVRNSAVLFQIAARTFDPGASLDRLARLMYREQKGSVQMRLTVEQYQALCRKQPPERRANAAASKMA